MKTSVVIPAHNEEKYIPDTLKAILDQDYPDLEVIVVDNNSSDNTARVAENFPIKVVHESRKGTQWARECGRKEAKGEIVVNIDADCLPERHWLSYGMHHFNDERVVAVTGPYDYYDAPYFFRKFSLLTQKYIYSGIHKLFQLFDRGVIIEGNVLFRSSALDKIGGYDTSFTFYGDGTDTAKRISSVGRIVFDRNLIMKTSARRFKAEGILKVSSFYIFHFFKVAIPKNSKAGNL